MPNNPNMVLQCIACQITLIQPNWFFFCHMIREIVTFIWHLPFDQFTSTHLFFFCLYFSLFVFLFPFLPSSSHHLLQCLEGLAPTLQLKLSDYSSAHSVWLEGGKAQSLSCWVLRNMENRYEAWGIDSPGTFPFSSSHQACLDPQQHIPSAKFYLPCYFPENCPMFACFDLRKFVFY